MAKGLDLLLVNVGGTKKKAYQDLSRDYSAVEPPFWAALTAGFIRRRGFDVRILDANAENMPHNEVAEAVKQYNPSFTNIVVYGQHPSASTQLMTGVGALCQEIKSRNPERKLILTGLHPSALPERTLREESCDFVAEGEGFHTLLELLKGTPLSLVPGLWARQSGTLIRNPRAKNIQDLTSELGDVAWDLLPLTSGKYRAHNHQCLDDFSQRPHYASISTSLGCPFKCDFCSIHQTFGERKIRHWDPRWAVSQISHLAEDYGVKVFKIIDEMFILNPNHYLAIADGLIERGLGDKINIWAYARVDTTKEQHLEKLRKAGFKWLCFGFESGNNEILKEAHKGNFTREDMLRVSEKVRSFDISILANYMFGFPNDTLETMNETLNLAQEQNCEFVNMYCATAWPGSDLYNQVVKKGVKLPETWADYAQHAYGFHPLPTNKVSAAEVLAFRDSAFNTYFTNQQYLNMVEGKFGKGARAHIEEMTRVKLKRKLLGDER